MVYTYLLNSFSCFAEQIIGKLSKRLTRLYTEAKLSIRNSLTLVINVDFERVDTGDIVSKMRKDTEVILNSPSNTNYVINN